MNREEILEKSRQENKNQDIFEKDVIVKGYQYSCLVATVIATLFFIVQIFTGGGMNYGHYAVVFAMPTGQFWFKYINLRRKHELILAVLYSLCVIGFSIAHLYSLIAV